MAQVNNPIIHLFLLEKNTPYYCAMGFVIGIATVIGGLYFTKIGKEQLRSYWSFAVGAVAFAILCVLIAALKHRQSCWKMIAEAPAWAKTIQTGIILTLVILVCYIGDGSLVGILCFTMASFASLGLLPLLRNDLGLVDFFISGAISTSVVRFGLGSRTWVVLVGCIAIIYLRNVLEKGVAIAAAAIDMGIDEDVELENQAPQIGVAIPAAAIEIGIDEDVEREIQAPQIGVAIENEESDDDIGLGTLFD